MAIARELNPEDELTRLLTEYSERLNPHLYEAAKRTKPELFF
jgi:hypothetical protein